MFSLLSNIYDREPGLVRHIMEYVGPNAAPPEDEGWQMDKLTKLTKANAAKDETIASLKARNAAIVANNTALTQSVASQQQTIANSS